MASLPTLGGGPAAAATARGQVTVIGRDGIYSTLGTVEAYDPAANTWTALAATQAVRSYATAALGRMRPSSKPLSRQAAPTRPGSAAARHRSRAA